MRFNTKIESESRAFIDRAKFLVKKGANIELIEKRKKRTFKQNNYFHLICVYFGMSTGYTIDEVKIIIKQIVCVDIFEYEKNNIKFYRSTSDLSTLEMSKVIDLFIHYSGNRGIKLPDANDYEFLNYIENEINKYDNRYLNYK